MIRIDIFGPPGVGKSTMLTRLRSDRRVTSRWIMDDEVRKCCAAKIIAQERDASRRRRLQLAMALPKVSTLYSKLICQDEQYRALERSAAFAAGFVESRVQGVLQADAALSLRVKSTNDLLLALGQFAVYSAWMNEAHVLFDNHSLAHFGTRFAFVDRPLEFAAEFCRTMPMPAGAVFCRDEPVSIVERIRKRAQEGNLIPMHANKSDRELIALVATCLGMCESGADALRARNVPVLEVDLSSGIEASAVLLAKFLGGSFATLVEP